MNDRATVLAVDDNEINLAILEELLQDEFEVKTAASGEEAISICGECRPDLILLDIMMPGMDGYETCKRLREDAMTRRSKVIMVSAKALVDERVAGYEAGADDYVTKPFNNQEILAKIRVYAELSVTEKRLQETNERLQAEILATKKAREAQEMTHTQLVEASRMAGMAEMASGVLHNVGNVLNSVNIAASQVSESVTALRIDELMAVNTLLQAHSDDLAVFLTEDDRGRLLPEFLDRFAAHLKATRTVCAEELEQLAVNIDHIKEIVKVQQSAVKSPGATSEAVSVEDVFEDALRICLADIERNGIKVTREFETLEPVRTDRNGLLQILINLISNAKHACQDGPASEKLITLGLRAVDDHVELSVADNGIGIPPENSDRIFQHGFTTKVDGHGFGLHNAALNAKNLGGSLSFSSRQPEPGTIFQLCLPITAVLELVS